MGLCVSKPMESSTESTKTTRNTKSKLTKSNSSVVQDPRSHKITRVNGASIKSLGNALFFPDKAMPCQECRTKPHMHHKFCIIDCGQSKKDYTSNTKLMNGSFNWTRQAVLENQDNVMVLEGSVNFPMINAYQQAFNMMWSKYERFVLPRAG